MKTEFTTRSLQTQALLLTQNSAASNVLLGFFEHLERIVEELKNSSDTKSNRYKQQAAKQAMRIIGEHVHKELSDFIDLEVTTSSSSTSHLSDAPRGIKHLEFVDDFKGLTVSVNALDLLCSERNKHYDLLPTKSADLVVTCPKCIKQGLNILWDQEIINDTASANFA